MTMTRVLLLLLTARAAAAAVVADASSSSSSTSSSSSSLTASQRRHAEWKANPFTVDYFGRRLAEARDDEGRRMEGTNTSNTSTTLFSAEDDESATAEDAVAAAAEEAATAVCENDEGLIDDDASLSEHPLAQQYGLEGCASTYDMLVQFMGNADMLCKGMGVGMCNCTCAGTDIQSSVKTIPLPLSEVEPLTVDEDPFFDCESVKNMNAAGDDLSATLLPHPDSGVDLDTWHCKELGEMGVLLWHVDEDGETIHLAAEFVTTTQSSPSSSSVGIGISANGGMYGADLLWIRKEEEGQDYDVVDMFSRGYSESGELVTIDDSQDATLHWIEESNDRIAFRVSRYIKSCDADDDLEVLAGQVPFLWAIFPTHEHAYHGPTKGDRGTVYIDLLNPHADGVPEAIEDLYAVDLRFGDDTNEIDGRYVLEDDRVNSYVCRSFEMPNNSDDEEYHIVSYEFLPDTVPAEANNMVHHIVLFACDEDPYRPDPHYCTDMNAGCYAIDASWAVGIPTQYLPKEAGLRMKRFYYMQMHYENLGLESGIRDGSGLRITYTPKLREQEYSYMVIGADLGSTEPLDPGLEVVDRRGYCPSNCLASNLPSEGVTVHSQFFHSHLHGRSLITQHMRDGKELVPLGDMKYYDFNHQRFKYTPHQPKLMPGDELLTTCTYSTADVSPEDGPVKFGLETMDEMCFNIFGYYPASDLRWCAMDASTEEGGWCGWEDGAGTYEPLREFEPMEVEEPDRCKVAATASEVEAAEADGGDVQQDVANDVQDEDPGEEPKDDGGDTIDIVETGSGAAMQQNIFVSVVVASFMALFGTFLQ